MKSNLQANAKLKSTYIILMLFCLMVERSNYLNAQCSVSLQYSNATCIGCNGSAQSSAISGTSPYTFLWSTGNSNSNLYNLCAGTYTLTVKDATGCLSTSSVKITKPTQLTITTAIIKNINCFGDCDGKIVATASGGTPSEYKYTWTTWAGGISGATASNLCAIGYTVSVNDNSNCMGYTSSPSLNQPTKFVVSTSTTPETIGKNNGTATFSAFGGTTPYTYTWSNGYISNPITGLSCGTYGVTVSDNNGCLKTATAVVACVTGINEFDEDLNFRMYPNPTVTTLMIETMANKPCTLQLINLIGEIVYDGKELIKRKTTIDIGLLPKGIYIVQVSVKDSQLSGRRRLIIQ